MVFICNKLLFNRKASHLSIFRGINLGIKKPPGNGRLVFTTFG